VKGLANVHGMHCYYIKHIVKIRTIRLRTMPAHK
jgi:hypothetical protein